MCWLDKEEKNLLTYKQNQIQIGFRTFYQWEKLKLNLVPGDIVKFSFNEVL